MLPNLGETIPSEVEETDCGDCTRYRPMSIELPPPLRGAPMELEPRHCKHEIHRVGKPTCVFYQPRG